MLLLMLKLAELLLHFCERVGDSMGEPHFVVLIGFKVVLEAESVVEVHALTSSVVVVEVGVVVVLVVVHPPGVVAVFRISGDVVLSVSYEVSPSEPTCALFFVLVLRPNARLHAYLVETRGFGKVQDVELNTMEFFLCPHLDPLVDYFEVVPLVVPFCI